MEGNSKPNTADMMNKHGDTHNVSLSAILTELSVIQQPKQDQPSFLSKLDNKVGSFSTHGQGDNSREIKEDVSTSGISKHSFKSNSTFDWDVFLGDKSSNLK